MRETPPLDSELPGGRFFWFHLCIPRIKHRVMCLESIHRGNAGTDWTPMIDEKEGRREIKLESQSDRHLDKWINIWLDSWVGEWMVG